MAETLTYAQRQAVEHRGGKLLVSAAAGSGKTKVLVDRLMGYILDPVSPAHIDDFLIITYTKAAAGELRSKIAAKLSELIATMGPNKHLQQQMQRLYLAKISTVHGFCTDILRQYAYRLNISADFRVGDEGECLQLQLKALENIINAAYDSVPLDPDFCSFVDTQGLGRDDRQIPEIIMKVYNSARCHLNPEQWLDWCVAFDSETDDAGETPWGRYLLDDLRDFLSLQIDAFQNCIAAGEKLDNMEKPVALFRDIVVQLKQLSDSKRWDEVVANQHIEFGRLTFSKKCTDLLLPEQMKAVRNACKDGLSKRLRSFVDGSEQILIDLKETLPSARGLVSLVRAFAEEYDRLKRNRGILDFSDLEHRTLDLFWGKKRSSVTAVASEIGDNFREIMVDEYQDSNEIQDAIFTALTDKKQNCFMVGDVKQSIYQFRLADPSIFIEKYNTYTPVDSERNGRGSKVLLSHNFRSSGGVISAVNDVFSLCMSPEVGGLRYGEEEMLREGIPHIPLSEPEVSLYGIDVQQDTYAEESRFVADRICELMDGTHFVRDGDKLRPICPEDIVILLRSPGSVGAEFQYALQQHGIRCTMGDTADLLQTEEISTVCAILQIINNPLQDIPLVAAMTSPVFAYTAEDLAVLRSKDKASGIYALLQAAEDEKSRTFLNTLNDLRSAARWLSVTELLSEVYSKTKILSVYASMPDGDIRFDNLQTFFQIVSDYETNGPKELGRFLEYLDSAQQRGLSSSASQQDRGTVTIMSIHKSKGLEFPVVFLCGLSRSFNQESARSQVLCDKDLGLGLGNTDAKLRVRYPTIAKRAISTKILREGLSEEMRVLYVAMTRARDRLIMTYAVKNLAGDLQDFAMRLDMSSAKLLASCADCPGAWVLQSALTRSEAGAFFALGGHPSCAQVRDDPWLIAVADPAKENSNVMQSEDTVNTTSNLQLEQLKYNLDFSYQNQAATQIPSKLTATQLKGRLLDLEISDGANSSAAVSFRKPSSEAKRRGMEYGSAMHSVLQHIQYSACHSAADIQAEIHRLAEEQLISGKQVELADPEKLFAFFQSDIGKKLLHSEQVIREFKFSIMEDAGKYYENVRDEKILLQGIVDCALIEDDGIIVIDFKTDIVTGETIENTAQKYGPQVKAYSDALSRIFCKPVKQAMLYFFAGNTFVTVV